LSRKPDHEIPYHHLVLDVSPKDVFFNACESKLSPYAIPMRAYLITTGTVFGLITLAHMWRVFLEGPHLAKDPFFIALTFLAAALCVWACRLLSKSSRP
jgi:hypothetical protein